MIPPKLTRRGLFQDDDTNVQAQAATTSSESLTTSGIGEAIPCLWWNLGHGPKRRVPQDGTRLRTIWRETEFSLLKPKMPCPRRVRMTRVCQRALVSEVSHSCPRSSRC